MKLPLILLGCVFLSACELQEVVTTSSDDIVIAEVYLRADQSTQNALLHRTRQGENTASVPGARIEVTNAAGQVMPYFEVSDSVCVVERPPGAHVALGTCYRASAANGFRVQAGERYTLRILLPDGGEMTGSTTVPGDFQIVKPADRVCALPPATTFEISWTSSESAWVYASETYLGGLRDALAQQGIIIEQDPLRLFGLSITNSDTTIVFPSEFGLFDRFSDDLVEALVAIQNGLPAGVVGNVTVAAADRNYVNWERGGNFNPSGLIRIGNIRGDGHGVFGSLVSKSFQVRVGSSQHPPC
ncbi:MAG TPA: DUF4249 family protein [Longimicrobiales bacterium]